VIFEIRTKYFLDYFVILLTEDIFMSAMTQFSFTRRFRLIKVCLLARPDRSSPTGAERVVSRCRLIVPNAI